MYSKYVSSLFTCVPLEIYDIEKECFSNSNLHYIGYCVVPSWQAFLTHRGNLVTWINKCGSSTFLAFGKSILINPYLKLSQYCIWSESWFYFRPNYLYSLGLSKITRTTQHLTFPARLRHWLPRLKKRKESSHSLAEGLIWHC